jgi:hypothetical protein
MGYDFKSLSSYDFALLARDLLQVTLGNRLETFSEGPDCGIDFRYRDSDSNLIVQSKHYAESGYNALLSTLRRKERAKVEKLRPTRYLLATSVPLTPNRKEEILEILKPYCLTTSDIYGREDLNGVLSQNDEVERRHFKLWLTSEAVLRRVLHAGIFVDSEAHLDRVRLRLRRYVQNPSFDRARTVLDKHHYCIIAGIPGIGKTTLAEVLLADLVDRQGFEPFRIAHDLSELRSVKNSKVKQVFYFDDFLGKTSLEKLRKNEDQRLIELMEDVAQNENWRFILTTREYILNTARIRYEAFAQPSIDFRLCVVNLADYTPSIRAKILYNHIYFSDLPRPHKLALLQNRGYETILRHRNYNPRVIDYMTQARHACVVAPSLYLNEFADSLEHPTRIWDHAFRHQISEAARHLLLVLGTLPDEILLADLESAFWQFYRLRQKKFGFTTTSSDWSNALKQLDGSFISIQRVGSDHLVSFHNPSIRDYVEDFLSNSDNDVEDLIYGGIFYEQYARIWSGRRGNRYRGVELHKSEFLHEFKAKIYGPSVRNIRQSSNGRTIGVIHWPPSHESRARFAIQIANELGASADSFLNGAIQGVQNLWDEQNADREDLVLLLQDLTARGLKPDDSTFKAAQHCLTSQLDEIDHFRAIASFATAYPDILSASDIDILKSKFIEFAEEYSDGWDDDDPDWLYQVAGDLQFVAERLEVNVDHFTAPLSDRADEIESERVRYEPEDDYGWRPSQRYTDDADTMFRSLLYELES